jgi:hypothetical protein
MNPVDYLKVLPKGYREINQSVDAPMREDDLVYDETIGWYRFDELCAWEPEFRPGMRYARKKDESNEH